MIETPDIPPTPEGEKALGTCEENGNPHRFLNKTVCPNWKPTPDTAGTSEGEGLRQFLAAQDRVQRAKRELKSAEDAVWALLGEKRPNHFHHGRPCYVTH